MWHAQLLQTLKLVFDLDLSKWQQLKFLKVKLNEETCHLISRNMKCCHKCNSKHPVNDKTNVDPFYFKVRFVPYWVNQFQVPTNNLKHRVTIPYKWSFENLTLFMKSVQFWCGFRVVFMQFLYAFHFSGAFHGLFTFQVLLLLSCTFHVFFIFTSHIWGRGNFFVMSVCLSVWAITFEGVDIETSFLVWCYILTISTSSLSIKVIG